MTKTDIRKEDTVAVISGRDRGKQGRVLSVDRKLGRVLVEHVMMMKKTRATEPATADQGRRGGKRVLDRGVERDAGVFLVRPGTHGAAGRRRRAPDEGLRQVRQSDREEDVGGNGSRPEQPTMRQ